jgi:hypothetical protein
MRAEGPAKTVPDGYPDQARAGRGGKRGPGRVSRAEIGQALYVSPNTVKTHTRAIYRKLGTASRQDAIRRAREIGILC